MSVWLFTIANTISSEVAVAHTRSLSLLPSPTPHTFAHSAFNVMLLFFAKEQNTQCLTWTYWIDKIYMYINNTFKRVERKTFMWRHKNNFSFRFFFASLSIIISHICVEEREKTRELFSDSILTFICSNGENVCSLSTSGREWMCTVSWRKRENASEWVNEYGLCRCFNVPKEFLLYFIYLAPSVCVCFCVSMRSELPFSF